MMKLGIVVVYLVDERNEKLLDLHLSQIEKHTKVPYTIYASVNRLLPKFRQKLAQHPQVKICPCPSTDLRSGDEHSFYLEHLVRYAVEDGATHIVTLHVDSFPIRSSWAEELAGRLSESCVLAAIMREKQYGSNDRKPLSACIFFSRDFYLRYHPTFLLSKSESASPEYEHYAEKFGRVVESGVGYGFKVYSEGLSWYPLLRSNKAGAHPAYGHIYGDLVFHLGEAAWRPYYYGDQLKRESTLHDLGFALFLYRVKETTKAILPSRLRKSLAAPVQAVITAPIYEHIRLQLLDDPDSYLNYLRTGDK